MNHIKDTLLLIILFFYSSCATNNSKNCPLNYEKLKFKNISHEKVDKKSIDSATLKFTDAKNNQIDLVIYWIDNKYGEYSRIGPVTAIKIKENGKPLNLVPQIKLNIIEDINFENCQLIRHSNNKYILCLSWGVGESLSLLNNIYIE